MVAERYLKNLKEKESIPWSWVVRTTRFSRMSSARSWGSITLIDSATETVGEIKETLVRNDIKGIPPVNLAEVLRDRCAREIS